MNKNGFVISVDALLALSVALVLFITAAFYLARVESNAKSSVLLKEFSMDTGTVLEKTGLLENAVERNSGAELASFLNKLPENICIEVSVFKESDLNNAELTVLRSGCTAGFKEKTSLKRGFLTGSPPSFYVAEISAWYRVSE